MTRRGGKLSPGACCPCDSREPPLQWVISVEVLTWNTNVLILCTHSKMSIHVSFQKTSYHPSPILCFSKTAQTSQHGSTTSREDLCIPLALQSPNLFPNRGISHIYSNHSRGLFKVGDAEEQPQNLSGLTHKWLISFWWKAHCKPSLIFRATVLHLVQVESGSMSFRRCNIWNTQLP